MAETRLSGQVRRFILATIPSVPHLEALLLMRAEPATAWTPLALSRRLYVDAPAAGALLVHLTEAGLFESQRDGSYCYKPATPELAAVVAELGTEYSRNLVAIANLIHSIGERKAQRFADAFRWRRDS